MQFTIEVNNKSIRAEKGETILSALNRNGIIIPTLCRMAEFTPTGACRMCVVEVEGREQARYRLLGAGGGVDEDKNTLPEGHQGTQDYC